MPNGNPQLKYNARMKSTTKNVIIQRAIPLLKMDKTEGPDAQLKPTKFTRANDSKKIYHKINLIR